LAILSNEFLEPYLALLGSEVINQLQQTVTPLKGIKVVHVNSTQEGGGVAEILVKMVPFTQALGLDVAWEVINGDSNFFQCTKLLHNLLQGMRHSFPSQTALEHYEKINADNAERLKTQLNDANIVIIHDPQPLPLIAHFPNRKGKWIWRCHIDVAFSPRALWKYLKTFIDKYDASIFSLEDFVRPLPHPIYLIPPSIDPLSDKNISLDMSEVTTVYESFKIDRERPVIIQISRFDRFKDPLGVIEAYRLAKKHFPSLQLVLAGGGAADDPDSNDVLEEINNVVQEDPDIYVLNLPPAPRIINCLQQGADIVLQKSVREGFGLTVTEALWKKKAVIGGNTGGIRLQVFDHYTGFLVNTPEGAASRIRQLLQYPQLRDELGIQGKKLVKENFLITRHLREYLIVMAALLFPGGDRIDLSRLQ
jgi:trehalose synthase